MNDEHSAFRIGILGGGNISGTHALAAAELPDARVVAVYGESPQAISTIAKAHGAATYLDVAEFLAHRPMDLVIIGTPSGLHAEHTIAAAEHGLHVLVEKPLEVSSARAEAAIEACARAGTRLGVIYQERTAPELVWLKGLIGRGELGDVFLVSARLRWYRDPDYYASSRWRGVPELAGGGALMNQGTHTVDLLLWLLGDVDRVYARARTALHDTDVEDTLVATLEFANGAIAGFEATTAGYPGFPRQVEITGTRGTVVIRGESVVSADLLSPPTEPRPVAVADDSPRASSALISDTSGHRRVLEDFLDSIASGRAPLCDGREASRSVAVVEAMYRSVRTGGPVALG
jgi:UDP-N-acetyl-2-amino-2-deoxyglucuronate dehydrogenase